MLTQVQDAVPGPVPAPALQLLVLRVLQPPVVEDHTDDALRSWKRRGKATHQEHEPTGTAEHKYLQTVIRQCSGYDLKLFTTHNMYLEIRETVTYNVC